MLAGRYRIREPIGRGARSVAYAADDPLLRREVAVEVFTGRAETAPDLQVQEAEARLAAGLNHHALTTLFDAGIDTTDARRPRIYLVMERVAGLDLCARLALHGPLRPQQVILLGLDLAEGLRAVHERGFLHRDVKPANLLIADRGFDTRIRGKLADFGISSAIGLPEPGGFTTGTAAYLSPEQVEGRPPTTASDVYALGLVLLEALTGTTAYPGSVHESAFARLERDPRIPSSAPDPLPELLRRMTARSPEHRPELDDVVVAFHRASQGPLVGESGGDDAAADERPHVLVAGGVLAAARTTAPQVLPTARGGG